MRNAFRFGGRTMQAVTAATLLLLGPACSSVTDSLLEVEDPDLIMPSNVNSATSDWY